MFYRIADIVLDSQIELPSFANFLCEETEPNVVLKMTEDLPGEGQENRSGFIAQRKTAEGWFYHHVNEDDAGLMVSPDYRKLRIRRKYEVLSDDPDSGSKYIELIMDPEMSYIPATWSEEALVRMAVECLLVRRGYVSLHSACIELDGEAIAFSGPSGTGKSTRANAWMEAFPDAKLVSGDRPLIDVRNLQVYGVPWDGKEKCYRNVHYPIKAIFEVRRSDSTYIRKMSYEQRRKLLMRQCFLPMWDTETAVIQMINIARLAANAPILRIFCGPAATDAEALRSIYNSHNFREERTDMKAKSGFVLRNIAGEQILMPTGDNIGKFKGTVLLNDVSAFVWEKLQNPMSKEDLLQAIVDNYEVEEAVAAKDLDDLLATLDGFGVIEND